MHGQHVLNELDAFENELNSRVKKKTRTRPSTQKSRRSLRLVPRVARVTRVTCHMSPARLRVCSFAHFLLFSPVHVGAQAKRHTERQARRRDNEHAREKREKIMREVRALRGSQSHVAASERMCRARESLHTFASVFSSHPCDPWVMSV